jgi:hypothetical protein
MKLLIVGILRLKNKGMIMEREYRRWALIYRQSEILVTKDIVSRTFWSLLARITGISACFNRL